MLKITVQDSFQPATLKLEGQLKGPWVEETERIWKSCGRPVTAVDLHGVTSVDTKGKKLLAEMQRHGISLLADTPMMRYVIEQAARTYNG